MLRPFGFVALLAVLTLPPTAAFAQSSADAGADAAEALEDRDPATIVKQRPWFVGAGVGLGLADVSHPELATPHLIGPVLELHAGYVLSPRWSISIEATNFEQLVTRDGPGERFATGRSWLHTQAGCECVPASGGGWVKDAVLLLTTVGQRIDFAPFGPDGPYLGATGGVAFISGIDDRAGAMASARAGVRLRPLAILAVQLEGGLQGQTYSDASATLGYGALEGRLHF